MKFMILFMTLFVSNIHADTFSSLTPTSVVHEKFDFQAVKGIYKHAIAEYKNANYGASKELFEATVQRTDAFPKAYFYLGDIYGSIHLPFKNIKLAKMYYKECLAHRKTTTEIKQICYIRLSWIDGIPESERQEYRTASKKLGDTYYSKWLDVGDARENISKSLEMVGIAEDAKKPTDKDIFKRANYIVGE